MYLLDTNTCIGWLRANQPNIVARIEKENSDNICICSVVVGELLYGVERSKPEHRDDNLLKLIKLRQQFLSMSFDDKSAEAYGQTRAFLAAAGNPIGPNDLIIASIALSNQLTLVTHNTSEFNRVPNLRIEDWQ
jgi:tRNA(fMet)-specific endonuclease VapC